MRCHSILLTHTPQDKEEALASPKGTPASSSGASNGPPRAAPKLFIPPAPAAPPTLPVAANPTSPTPLLPPTPKIDAAALLPPGAHVPSMAACDWTKGDLLGEGAFGKASERVVVVAV